MILGNTNALLANRSLSQTSSAIAKSLERLSTGKRINGPSDGVVDLHHEHWSRFSDSRL